MSQEFILLLDFFHLLISFLSLGFRYSFLRMASTDEDKLEDNSAGQEMQRFLVFFLQNLLIW